MLTDQNMEAAAVKLAEALDNTEAIRRYSINVFTEEQEELIRSLFEAGKIVEAQKIMLDAMNKNKAYGDEGKTERV